VRKIDKLIVHCSATPEFKEFDVEDITEWHLTRGWSDCGYHIVIKLDGTVQTGRPISKVGAGVYGKNRGSIHICYIGGMDRTMDNWIDTRTAAQKLSLTEVLTNLKKQYPASKIFGHNDFTNKKVCPCFDAKKEYKNISDGVG
jgi:N-acetylmuramoyl-L-alanine amidase|tara:strand:+ start:34 stop:462 length:429 start_codon:yes stop_codon:yes gene_type:complete